MCGENREPTAYEKLEYAGDDLKFEREAYLRKHGWNNNCGYPGGLVLWEHTEQKLRGVSFNTAWSIQAYLEHQG